MNLALEPTVAFIKRNKFWIELATYVLLAAGTALWVGRDAYRQAGELRREGQRLQQMRSSADLWLGSFQPATSGETQQWQTVQDALQQLGASSDSRLTLVEVITRRAERAGLTNVRTVIAASDSITPTPRQSAPPVTLTVAEYSIIVDFRGNLAATRAFLANLPPAVGIQKIDMGRSGPTMGTRAVLTVYEAVASAPI